MSLTSEVELMRRLPLFAKLDLPVLKLVCFSSDRLTFEPGQVLFNEGDPGDAAYILIEGHVDIIAATPKGRIVVSSLGPMEIVGEIAIFADVARTATVTATTRVETLRIAKEQFMSIIRTNPDAAIELLRQLALRLANTTVRLTKSLSSAAPAPTPAGPAAGQSVS